MDLASERQYNNIGKCEVNYILIIVVYF